MSARPWSFPLIACQALSHFPPALMILSPYFLGSHPYYPFLSKALLAKAPFPVHCLYLLALLAQAHFVSTQAMFYIFVSGWLVVLLTILFTMCSLKSPIGQGTFSILCVYLPALLAQAHFVPTQALFYIFVSG